MGRSKNKKGLEEPKIKIENSTKRVFICHVPGCDNPGPFRNAWALKTHSIQHERTPKVSEKPRVNGPQIPPAKPILPEPVKKKAIDNYLTVIMMVIWAGVSAILLIMFYSYLVENLYLYVALLASNFIGPAIFIAYRPRKGGVKKERSPKKIKDRKVKEKKEVKQADKFWSENHPNAFGLAKALLPRLHIVIICAWIMYSMYWEMMRGNADFMLDWYQASPMPTFMSFFTVDNAFQYWLDHYGVVFFLVLSIVIMVLVTVYYSFWRLVFKDYWKFSEGSRRYEGRCYWRTNGGLMKWWDRKYHSPVRTQNSYWIKIGWWPPLNLINPTNSLVRLDTSIDEKCQQKGIFAISVNERPLRRKVANEPKHWTTYGGCYLNGDIPNQYAQDYFTLRSKVLVDDTTDLSFGNADTRNSVMLDGLRLSKPSIRRFILDSRERK